MQCVKYREVEYLLRGDDAEKGFRLPVEEDRSLSERQVGDIRGRQMVSQRRDDMWCPSRARVGSFVSNVMYVDFLRMDLPAGTSIIGFAADALVVCAADDVRILELRINESLLRVKRWLDSRGLKMALERTKALLFTDRRSFQYPRIVLGEHKVEWKTSIKYLGVQLGRRRSFGDHLKIAAAKAIQCEANLARLMPNIGEPREVKRRLVANVVYSKLLYAALVWANALQNHTFQRKLFSAQRLVAAENSFSI